MMSDTNAASYQLSGKRVWVAGHRGMVGSALMRRLAREDCELLSVPHKELDLIRQADVEEWIAENKPDAIFLAAATVGGIMANDTRPADFLFDNLMIETNIIHSSWKVGVEKLLFLGSSCIYPRITPQPITEEALMTAALEPTNQWYAIAKITGIKLCQAYRQQHGCDFISAQPTNLFGPGDNFDLMSSHVVPALMVKAHNAKASGTDSFEVWGSGKPRREFLYVDDLADALVFLMNTYSGDIQINVGMGKDMTIRELAKMIADVVGFAGSVSFDSTKPDGTPQKLLDVSRLSKMGWKAKTEIRDGFAKSYSWYLEHVGSASN